MAILNKKNYLQLYGEIFERVQLERVFKDGITFVDSALKKPKEEIVSFYETHKKNPDFNFAQFIDQYFDIPQIVEIHERPQQQEVSMKEYIEALWTFLYREAEKDNNNGTTLIHLPRPYIVPGGRFRSIYYWDSYFTMLGLAKSGHHVMLEHMIHNFAYLLEHVGFIPNGNRAYFITRSQPPFFALMLELYIKVKGFDTMKQFIPLLEKEYDFWMNSQHKVIVERYHLNRYYDEDDTPREESFYEDTHLGKDLNENQRKKLYRDIRAGAESGWDFSSRWFADTKTLKTIKTTDLLPIDLNCLLYDIELKLAQWYYDMDNLEKSQTFQQKAKVRFDAIQKYFWSESEGFFFDYNHTDGKLNDCWTLAGAYPLFFQVATKEQGEKIAYHIKHKFMQIGGLTTTTNQTEEQWDYPNGWAPLQWLVIRGLEKYGYTELASEISERWIRTCDIGFKAMGSMLEKYNVVDPGKIATGGEYALQTGFGWTNGVITDLLE